MQVENARTADLVFVHSKEGKPLMPCKPAVPAELLERMDKIIAELSARDPALGASARRLTDMTLKLIPHMNEEQLNQFQEQFYGMIRRAQAEAEAQYLQSLRGMHEHHH